MSTEQEGLHGILDKEALDVVKAVRKKTSNAILVRFSALGNMQELGGMSSVTHSENGEKPQKTL